MAAQVNKKFVLILAGCVVLTCALLAAAAVYTLNSRGPRLIAEGDQLYAEGKFREASSRYSRAVNRDPTNNEWLLKWRSALTKTTPATQGEYERSFSDYVNLQRTIAMNQPGDIDAQMDFLELLDARTRGFGENSDAGLLYLIGEIDQRIAAYDAAMSRLPQSPDTESRLADKGRMLGLRGLVGAARASLVRFDEEQAENIINDLEQGASSDPTDHRYGVAKVRVHLAMVDNLNRDGRALPEDIASKRQAALDELARLLEEHPDTPEVLLLRSQVEFADRMRRSQSPEERVAAVQETQLQLLRIISQLRALPPEELSTELLVEIRFFAAQIQTREILEDLLALAEHADTEQPSARRKLLLAELQRQTGRSEEAMTTLESIRQMTRPPISIDGITLSQMQLLALNAQVETLIAEFERTQDAEFLTQAKARLQTLRDDGGVRMSEVAQRRAGEIALLEDRVDEAVAIFSALRTGGGGAADHGVLIPLARALMQQRNFGEAKVVYDEVLASGRRDLRTLLGAADAEFNLRNLAASRALYEESLRFLPDNADIQQRIALIDAAMSGDTLALGAANPVASALMEARRATAAGDPAAARSILQAASIEHPDDVRLVRELVSQDIRDNDRATAMQRVESALMRSPENRELIALRELVAEEDPVKASLRVIEISDLSELERELARFSVYAQFGMDAEAARSLRAAERLRPDDQRVIQIGFERALRVSEREGFAEAERFAKLASEHNVDERGGLLYRGRLELAKGNHVEAERLLADAVRQVPFDPFARRFLGLAQLANGRIDAALESLERAYRGKPDDAAIAVDFARVLTSTGRGPEAMRVLSPEEGILRFVPNNDNIAQMWLALEAEFGDRERAVEIREATFRRDPLNTQNTTAYIDLLMRTGEWQTADDSIKIIADDPNFDSLQAARLRAIWYARQDRVDAGRAVLRDYLESIPADERTVRPFLVAVDFEREANNIDEAIALLELARPYQNPSVNEVDRYLGDIHYSSGETSRQLAQSISAQQDPENHRAMMDQSREYYARAAQAYRRVVDAAGDNQDLAVVKRLAETHIRTGNLDEAQSILRQLPENDLQSMLLRAGIAQERDDLRTARRILDMAIEQHPNQPIGFLRRAQLNMGDSARFPDVVADLDRATQLRPTDTQAWAMLFQLYRSRGETETAFNLLRQAIDNNPQNEQLKNFAVSSLTQQGMLDEALALVTTYARQAPDDAEWQSRAGLLSYQMERYRESAEFYRRLYELDPSPANAADLLNTLLRTTPRPARADVNRLLPDVRRAPENWRLNMLLAKAYTFLGDDSEADRLTLKAYQDAARPYREWTALGDGAPEIARINQDPQIEIAGWFGTLVARFDDNIARAMQYVETTSALRPTPPMLNLYAIQRDLGEGRDLRALLERLAAQEQSATLTPFSALLYHRLRNQILYALGDYQGVVYACRAGLELAPNDVELNNNLAYTLAKHLDDAEGALPYAMAAERVAPRNAAVLDTVGWVYLQVGRHQDADRVLERAVSFASSPEERLPALLHRGFAKLELEDIDAAQRMLRDARVEWAAVPQNVRSLYAEELQQLESRLEQR